MRWNRLIARLQSRILLFVLSSLGVHLLLLYHWEDPLQFDFGGQQQNQLAIEIALAPPTPEPEPESETPPVEEKVVIEPAGPEPALPDPVDPPEPVIQESAKAVTEPPPQAFKKQPPPVEKAAQSTPAQKPKKQYVPFQEKKRKQLRKRIAQPKPPIPKPKTSPRSKPRPVTETSSKTIQESEAIKQSRAMIRRLIQNELGRHFEYPRIARRRGWEGKVHLEFTVQPNGKIVNIHILEGSRHGLLNRSAVQTMTRINQLNQISEGMLHGAVRMEIPIIYQLSNR